jgi:transcriptional regulator with XRE-family HTH domain
MSSKEGSTVARIKDSFATRLKALRKARGMSRYRLAKLTGVSNQALAPLEAGKSVPSWETVVLLARALGVEVTSFLTDADRAPLESDATAHAVADVPKRRPRGGKARTK